MQDRRLAFLALALVAALALAGCAAEQTYQRPDSPADDTGSTDDNASGTGDEDDPTNEPSVPDPGAVPEAVRADPIREAVSTRPGATLSFEGECENPGRNLAEAEWTVRRPGASYPRVHATLEAAAEASTWGPESASFTFNESGQTSVGWTCRAEDGRSTAVSWKVDVAANQPPAAERADPASQDVSATTGEAVTLEARCGNPDEDLDHATWEVRRPGESSPETVANLTVASQDDPWGPRSRSLTFEATGDATVRWTCVDDHGASDSATWTVTVEEDDLPYSTSPFETRAQSGNLTIHFVDVGQGDGVVLDFPDTTVVYDAGRWSGDGETAVRDHLQAEGVTDVHALVLSHPDADHTGDCDEILDALDVEYVFRPGIGSDTQTWSDCETAIQAEGAPEYTDEELDPGHYLNLSAHASSRLLHVDGTATDANEGSLVLEVDYGDFEFHLAGDATCANEDAILDRGYGRDVELLKVAHHGSDTSTCNPWLDATQPEVGVIGVGADNTYGHPTDTVLTRLEDHGTAVYRTDQNGTVTVTTDGTTWDVSVEKAPDTSTDDGGGDSTGSASDIAISNVHYDAEGNDHENLNDEYVVIENTGGGAVDLSGWTLSDEADHTYHFPSGFSLDAGATVTVYTGSGTDTDSELYWGSGSAVWNNGGDTAYLADDGGGSVDLYSW